MRSRRSAHDQVAEVARRRLDQLSAELAELRPDTDKAPGAHAAGHRDPANSWPSDPAEARRLSRPSSPPSDPPPQVPAGRHLKRPMEPALSAARWMEDRLPPALQGRVRLRLPHLVVVASLLLIALALTGWWVSRSRGAGTPLPVVATPDTELVPLARSPAQSDQSPDQSSAGSPSGAPVGSLVGAPGGLPGVAPTAGVTPTARIVVDVAGRVRRPGIATLPAGSRVVDALHAAGGARHGVHLGSLNLARVLTDGEQILVGIATPPGVAASAASAPTSGSASAPPMVNINSGSQTELEELPGVGPVTAQAIVEYRSENGAFTSVEQLLEVSGIGDATLAKIAPFVTL